MVDESPSPLLNVLLDIREEIRGTNERLDTQTARLGGRIDGVDGRIGRLEDVVHEGHLRLATEIVAVARAVGDVRDLLSERFDDRDRIDDHERRLLHLEPKVG